MAAVRAEVLFGLSFCVVVYLSHSHAVLRDFPEHAVALM